MSCYHYVMNPYRYGFLLHIWAREGSLAGSLGPRFGFVDPFSPPLRISAQIGQEKVLFNMNSTDLMGELRAELSLIYREKQKVGLTKQNLS